LRALPIDECMYIATMFLQSSDLVTVSLALVAILEPLGISNIIRYLLALLVDDIFDLILDFGNSYSILDITS
jgi:hypothetical protein